MLHVTVHYRAPDATPATVFVDSRASAERAMRLLRLMYPNVSMTVKPTDASFILAPTKGS